MNRRSEFLADRAALVDGRAKHVHDAAQCGFAHGHCDGVAGVGHHQTAAQAVRGAKRNGSHHAVTELLLHFQCEGRAIHFQSIINFGHLIAWKFHVNHGTNTLNNFSLGLHFSLQ